MHMHVEVRKELVGVISLRWGSYEPWQHVPLPMSHFCFVFEMESSCAAQAGLEYRVLLAPASCTLGLEMCTTTPS